MEGVAYLRQKIPKKSKAKIKTWVFFGPQITQLFEDKDFSIK